MSDEEKLKFFKDPKGAWKIWKKPKPEHHYIFGVDTVSGEDDGIIKHDYCVAWGMDRDGCDYVAKYRAQVDPDTAAEEVEKIAWWYNEALIIPERNTYGDAFIRHLNLRLRYQNIFKDVRLDERTKQRTTKLGFYTGPATKGPLVDAFAAAIRQGQIQMPDADTIDECLTFVVKPNGRASAEPGCHDDSVMAAALCLHAHLLTPIPDRESEDVTRLINSADNENAETEKQETL